ncbi:MAG: aromatic-ring-hydroxylating dioxygenase subunit beta [Noviherbaspirillum sp.]
MENTIINPELLQRVELLQAQYVDSIDDERYEEWPQFFTEQGMYRIISRDNYRKGLPFGFMYCDNRHMLRDRIISMRKANIFEPHSYRHVLGRTILSDSKDGELVARTNYMVARIMHDGAQELFSTGYYQDRIVEEDGQLRFKEKLVITDAGRIDVLLVIPL